MHTATLLDYCTANDAYKVHVADGFNVTRWVPATELHQRAGVTGEPDELIGTKAQLSFGAVMYLTQQHRVRPKHWLTMTYQTNCG